MLRLGSIDPWRTAARFLEASMAFMMIICLAQSQFLFSQAQIMSAQVAPADYQLQSQIQQPAQNIVRPQTQSEAQFQAPPLMRTQQTENPQHQQPELGNPGNHETSSHQSESPNSNPVVVENASQSQQPTQPQQPPASHQQPDTSQPNPRIELTPFSPQRQSPTSMPSQQQPPAPPQQAPSQLRESQPPPPPPAPVQKQQQPTIQQPQTPPQIQPQSAQPQRPLVVQQPQQQVLPSAPPSPIQAAPGLKYQPSVMSPLYLGHNPFIEILRPLSYADDNIVTLNLSHSHIYEIDSEAFVGQRFEHIDLSNNKLGLIHSKSFRIGPNHSRYNQPNANNTKATYGTRRPPPAHPKSVTIDLSHNPAIVALSGAFDHIDVPNCLLNFTNSTVELKYGSFKKYLKEHPGHLIDIDTVDCCDQEWLLGYKHNFVARTHCAHDPNLYLLRVSQQTIIDSCIAYVTSARHSMAMPSSGIIHLAATNGPRHSSGGHSDNQQYLTYLILGGTAMILTSLSIYIIFYMFSLKAAFVNQMQTQENREDKDSDVAVSNWHVSRYDMANAAASRRGP